MRPHRWQPTTLPRPWDSPGKNTGVGCHFLLAYKVSAERSAVKHMGFPLYVTCCFSLDAFNILSLCLIFISLISMCLGVFLLGFILYETLHFLDLIDYILSHIEEIFNYNLFKNFLIPFLFLFCFLPRKVPLTFVVKLVWW